jgi:hypothetical protein
MNRHLTPFLFSALAAVASAQSFERSPAGIPFPVASTANCENVRWNGNGPFGGAVNIADCGMPAAGAQYARLVAAGPLSGAHPAATLPARPLPAGVAELRLDAPAGATAVSFRYNFFNQEANWGIPDPTFNDGVEIAICDSVTGARVQSLVYVDTFSAIPAGACVSVIDGLVDTLSPGADTLTFNFGAPLPAGLHLSVACWNSFDDEFDSSVVLDCVTWGNSWEVGFLSGPRVQNVTTTGPGFVIGANTAVQTRGGFPFIEGYHCMVAQLWDGNIAQQFGGIAGDYWICTDRPFIVLSEGLLTGGVNPGRGPVVNFTLPLASYGAFCGRGVVIQSYIITELITNPSFTTALFGWFN